MGSNQNSSPIVRISLIVGVLIAIVFAYFDVSQPLGVAAGVIYVALISIALIAQSKALVVFFGLLGIALTVIGYFVSHPAPVSHSDVVLMNRALSVFVLFTLMLTGYILIRRHERIDARLIELASTDVLTGLMNRRAIMDEAERRVEEAQRYKHPLSALMIDIDLFKRVNDRFGHPVGDKVLCSVANAARDCMRRTDYLGRFGGEEFLLICPNTDAAEAMVLAERIRVAVAAIEKPGNGNPQNVNVSIGVAQLNNPEARLKDLVAAADRGLYRAKRGGRNKVVVETAEVTESDENNP